MSTSPPDHDQFDELLYLYQVAAEAAEIDGFFAGQLCVAGRQPASETLRALWRHLDQPAPEAEPLLEQLGSLQARIALAMRAGDFSYQLLLPDDEAPLGDRLAALVAWCQGFIAGLTSNGRLNDARMGDALRQMVADVIEISHLDCDECEEGEESERDYMALSEHLRCTAIALHAELTTDADRTATAPSRLH
ncbi:MAG TPA: UPF0149 family protein [Pseudomonadales bacterium]|nr:UPF0149 family protein [Pseudomonadales bacterium]